MKVLEESLHLLNRLGICSDRLNEPTNEFLQSVTGIVYLSCFLGPVITFSATYIYQNTSNTEAAINALLGVTAGSAGLGGFLTLGSKMKSVKLLYREILAMVKRGKDKN